MPGLDAKREIPGIRSTSWQPNRNVAELAKKAEAEMHLQNSRSSSSMLEWHLRVFVSFLFVTLAAHSAAAQGFSDNFEAATFDAFWTLLEQNGTIELSMDVSHSGIQSAKLTGPVPAPGQRNIWLTHTFQASTKGTLSVWFYDPGPAGPCCGYNLYGGLYAVDQNNPAMSPGFSVDVADWNGSYYVWYGPGMNATSTTVLRTIGWHQFTLEVTAAKFNAFIDQNIIGSLDGDFTFNEVRLLASGPNGDPATTFYFDDFTFIPPLAVPITKEDCKDGGWQHFVRADGSAFRNQGACVSYVNTGR